MLWVMWNISSFIIGALVSCDEVVVKRVWWRSEKARGVVLLGGKWLLLLPWRNPSATKAATFVAFSNPAPKSLGLPSRTFCHHLPGRGCRGFSRLLQYLLPPQLAVGRDHTGRVHTGRDHTGRDRDHTGRDHTGRVHTGRDHTGRDHTGTDHTGRVHTGRDHTGRDHTGRDHTGRVHTGRDHTGLLVPLCTSTLAYRTRSSA